jgi:hypothetical protein
MTSNLPTPRASTTWVSEADEQFADRMYVGAEIELPVLGFQAVSVRASGCQHGNGSRVTNLRLSIDGGEAVDLTPAQARQFAEILLATAGQAEELDTFYRR